MMTNVIWIVVLLAVALVLVRRLLPAKGIVSIRGAELEQKLKEKGNDRPELLDVREPSEFKSGHVPGFRNVPLGQIQRSLSSLPKDKEVVVMCRSGGRSMQAAKILKKNGFERVVNVSGGIMGWSGPTTK